MSRHPSSTVSGKPFDAAIIEAVWEKTRPSSPHRPLQLDAFGSLILKESYGNTNSKFGWEIDHIQPVSQGGGDNLENLQPLQWQNNRHKGDGSINGEHLAWSGPPGASRAPAVSPPAYEY